MEVELEQLRSERRQTELQLHIDTEKQAMLELAQQQEILRRRQLMLNAQGNSALTAQVMSASTSNQDVRPSNTPFIPELQAQAVLSCSSAAENSKVSAAHPEQMIRALKNPTIFQSHTIDGRYTESVYDGQHADIESQLVRNKNKLGVAKTQRHPP